MGAIDVPPHGQHNTDGAAFTADEVARMVVDARTRVVRTASGHPRFSGLSADDVVELFDATSEIVVRRHDSYANADHVGASLWTGMELRARDLFRRRTRRGAEVDPTVLELVTDDLDDHEDRISREQELLVVADFLAALAPTEAVVWRLVHGDDLSVVATAKHLGMSRHAVGEHLDAATRKLETFVAIAGAGEWCGRRRSDITRMLDGSDDAGTGRRALAHLDACAVCRRAYAAQVRETGRIAAGVLPVPALLVDGAADRGLLERLLDWLPQLGGGSGRMEAIGSALVGGGGLAGVAKVGAVVVTTATVAVGAGSTVVDRSGADRRAASTPRTSVSRGANRAPAPVAAVARRRAPVGTSATGPRTARPTGAAATSRASTRRRRADRARDVQELGTVESAPPSAATATAAPAPAPASAPAARPAAPRPGQESFLP